MRNCQVRPSEVLCLFAILLVCAVGCSTSNNTKADSNSRMWLCYLPNGDKLGFGMLLTVVDGTMQDVMLLSVPPEPSDPLKDAERTPPTKCENEKEGFVVYFKDPVDGIERSIRVVLQRPFSGDAVPAEIVLVGKPNSKPLKAEFRLLPSGDKR